MSEITASARYDWNAVMAVAGQLDAPGLLDGPGAATGGSTAKETSA